MTCCWSIGSSICPTSYWRIRPLLVKQTAYVCFMPYSVVHCWSINHIIISATSAIIYYFWFSAMPVYLAGVVSSCACKLQLLKVNPPICILLVNFSTSQYALESAFNHTVSENQCHRILQFLFSGMPVYLSEMVFFLCTCLRL